jgi:acyl-CoA synthetase (AMP-forming)/AMP-acid ligase II
MLADRGMGVGDVVALLSPNSSAFAGTFHGILRVGATATTINLLNTASDIATTADRVARTTPVHRRSVARESE